MTFAEVAVDAPAGHDRTFSYSIPPHIVARPGDLVRVPFGARTLQGVVFSLASTPEVPETREIIAVQSEGPALSEPQLTLARWISHHYLSPLFDAAALMLPAGARARSRTYLSLVPEGRSAAMGDLTALERRVVDLVDRREVVGQERLIRALGEAVRPVVEKLVRRRVLVRRESQGRRPLGPKYQHHVGLTALGREAAVDWLRESARRAPRQAALVSHLLEEESSPPLTGVRRQYGAGAVTALMARGWLVKEKVPVERDPLAGMSFPDGPRISLTPRQAEVALQIRKVLEDPSAQPRAFLIHGVTGSGKTEVYLDAVESCLSRGKKAIVLVPEIALTHQTVERFASRFPGRVTVLHSGMSDGQRFDQWWKIRRGGSDVVIGSRSAIFSPQPDLGLIVVDEEHEWTYKQQDASPRYDARRVALQLSQITGSVVVMGSASPDLVSYHRGLRKELRLLTLPQRVVADPNGGGRSWRSSDLASVEVVDMRRELREGNSDIFSRSLASSMDECLKTGAQLILFLNRRGSASYMQCRSCGAGLRCRRCDIALTHHREAGRLLCHYCGYRRTPPAKCPSCLSYRLSYRGVGTQAVAERVSERYPDASVLRWDRDAIKSPRSYEELLTRFRSGEAQVLVGTQMIAKGLHFPSVSLVGVVSADVGLNIPDYRSGERAFQLLCQIAGRAGRGQSAGKAIVQTYQPENYAVRAAAAQDYESFYEQEIEFRREQANPPYSKLIRLLYAHSNSSSCQREAARLADLIRGERDAAGYSDVDMLGPTPAYPPRLRGRYRWHLVLRGPDPRVLLDRVTVPSGWVVDVDPVTLT